MVRWCAMAVVLGTWSCKEVYCVIQFLWAENVFPSKDNHQLSVWWWHSESAACQRMLQSVKKWSDVCDDDCCEHSTSEGTGLRKLTSHNLRSVCWTGMVNRKYMRHCPLRTWIPQSMFMLHTELSGGWAQKTILRDCCFTFSWSKGHLCLLICSCAMEMHKNGCVCACVFLFISLFIQTVSDGSILETFT